MIAVTARTGTPHITPEMDAMWHRAMIGKQSIVLNDPTTTNFAAEVASNNEIKVRSGVGMIQGRFFEIPINTYDSVTISNGAQGYKRIDLIALQYTNNAETQVQSAELVVVQGEQSIDTPAAPAYTEGDLDAGDAIAQMPLYTVEIDGINIVSVTAQFAVSQTIEDSRISAATVAAYEALGFDPANYAGGGI